MPKVQISLLDIMKYIGERSRPLIEGEAVFKAGHIILCEIDSKVSKLSIFSLCLQTSSLTTQPHEINITLTADVASWICKCSCKAGQSGFCKHVVATLIYINRNEELDELSCTDVAQLWGKERKGLPEAYGSMKVREFCHPNTKTFLPLPSTSKHEDEQNFSLLSNCSTSSAIFKFLERSKEIVPRSSSSKIQENADLQVLFDNIRASHFLGRISIPFSHIQECCKRIILNLHAVNAYNIAGECVQGSDVWRQERQLRITGSRCYSIYTFNKTERWEHKAYNYFWPKGFENKYTIHGKTYESEALQFYMSGNKCKVVKPSFIICELFPWLGYSPDGIVYELGKPSKLLEIKCPFYGKDHPSIDLVESCDYLEIRDCRVQLKKKHQYYGQVQLGMALLNLPTTHFIVYSSFSKTYLNIVVQFDEDFAQDLITKTSQNYLNHMLHVYCENKM